MSAERGFIITGIGHSGTVFLHSILSKARNGTVGHERSPVVSRHTGLMSEDGTECISRPYSPQLLPEIDLLMDRCQTEIWGEINANIRYHAAGLARMAKRPVKVAFWVRNPATLLASLSTVDYHPGREREAELSVLSELGLEPHTPGTAFETYCWIVRAATEGAAMRMDRALHGADFPVLKFEQAISSWKYVDTICTWAGLEFDGSTDELRRIWEESSESPKIRNSHRERQRFPMGTWTDAMWDEFMDICGRTMEAFGYDAYETRKIMKGKVVKA